MKKLLSILASAIVLAMPLAVISTPAAAQTPAAPAAAPAATPAAPAKADKAMATKAPKAKKAKRKAKAKMAKKPAYSAQPEQGPVKKPASSGHFALHQEQVHTAA